MREHVMLAVVVDPIRRDENALKPLRVPTQRMA